jgi:phosphopantothenoylcysteine decarboxylase/phosphopantothenate--cysteine ligase
MGYALARNCAAKGAHVELISGPSVQSVEDHNIHLTQVQSAEDMLAAVKERFDQADVVIHAAAVADYRPKSVSEQKIKKAEDEMFIELTRTPDIASEMAIHRRNDQTIVGFALETDNEIENAISKLEKKKFDFIVLNTLRDEGAGFGHDTNKIMIIDRDHQIEKFELKSKNEVAEDIVQTILNRISVH